MVCDTNRIRETTVYTYYLCALFAPLWYVTLSVIVDNWMMHLQCVVLTRVYFVILTWVNDRLLRQP